METGSHNLLRGQLNGVANEDSPLLLPRRCRARFLIYGRVMGLRFVAIDFETANGDPTSACAVGLAIVRRGEIVQTFYHLIRPPTRRFSPFHVALHGIDWKDVRRAQDFREVWRQIKPWLEDAVLVAHSAGFEQNILRGCFEAFRIRPSRNEFVCTVQLAKRVLGFRRANLPYVCRKLGIHLRHHHAESDARASARIAIRAAEEADIRSARRLARL